MFTKAARLSTEGLLMTPRTTDTDGFFVSVLRAG
jgi:16S rRNA (cytosine967-C5)-methyltransferase